MPGHRAVAIANEFLSRRGTDAWPQQMLVQKLAHIANGWNLAINGVPLIEESAEAWDNGPVYRSIWNHVRDHGYRGPSCTLTDPSSGEVIRADLLETEKAIIDHVWRKYAPMGAMRLSQMTHEPNTPWTKAYFSRGRNAALNDDEIRQHYTELAMAGRAAEQ